MTKSCRRVVRVPCCFTERARGRIQYHASSPAQTRMGTAPCRGYNDLGKDNRCLCQLCQLVGCLGEPYVQDEFQRLLERARGRKLGPGAVAMVQRITTMDPHEPSRSPSTPSIPSSHIILGQSIDTPTVSVSSQHYTHCPLPLLLGAVGVDALQYSAMPCKGPAMPCNGTSVAHSS